MPQAPQSAPDIFRNTDPSFANAAHKNFNKFDSEADPKRIASTRMRKNAPAPSILDFMSDAEIKRLTKANTKKNLGGHRKTTFRSQLSKIIRRDTAPLEATHLSEDSSNGPSSMEATPIVDPFSAPPDSRRIHAAAMKSAATPSAPPPDTLETISTPVSPAPHGHAESFFTTAGKTSTDDSRTISLRSNPPESSSENYEEDMSFEIDPDAATPFSDNMSGPSSTTTPKVRSVRICARVRVVDYLKQKAVSSPEYSRGGGDDQPSSGMHFLGKNTPGSWGLDASSRSDRSPKITRSDKPAKVVSRSDKPANVVRQAASLFASKAKTPSVKGKGREADRLPLTPLAAPRSNSLMHSNVEMEGNRQRARPRSHSMVPGRKLQNPYGRHAPEVSNIRRQLDPRTSLP